MSEPITERGDPRDRIANQRMTPTYHGGQLFDASRTGTTKCPVCGELREPQEDTVRHCPADRRWDDGFNVKREPGCLNAYQPEYTEIPY